MSLKFVVAADCSLAVTNWSQRNKWLSETFRLAADCSLAVTNWSQRNKWLSETFRPFARQVQETGQAHKEYDSSHFTRGVKCQYKKYSCAEETGETVKTHPSRKTRVSSDYLQTALKAFTNDTTGALRERTHRTCHVLQTFPTYFFDVLLTVHLSIFISVINQLDAQHFCFTVSLFHTSTCFEHTCSSSGDQNCITQPLVSSHL